ncbi:MAG: DUF6088 family protein [Bacteroidetes bacterium]|nr:DUF6088 family protein [Bacteroidota bacterium]
MKESVHHTIQYKIKSFRKGTILFPADFYGLGSVDAINQTLSRLTKEGLIIRLGQGVYLYPKRDPKLGVLYPSMEKIAEAIAKRDQVQIIPSGAYAMNKLGLSTQVPMRVVYLTDGSLREIKVGSRVITFKSTTPKQLKLKGDIVKLVVQALKEIGQGNVTNEIKELIFKALKEESSAIIKEDAKLVPAWMAKILTDYLQENE